ncbi:MAG: phosphate ABC transporter permease PstA [Chloroflexi bacterium]|jgi:phosphate transport system permease protein|nr:phosphate ABC transporter permease PstA [Chloroflexota bacterium]
MAGSPMSPVTGRTHLAAAGARAVTLRSLESTDRGDRITSAVFLSLLLLGIGIALLSLAAILVWSLIEGAPRLDLNLLTNGPSTVRPAEAGFRTALLGSIMVVGGVIFLVVPIGVGAAVYLEEYASRERWWNRLIELNIQNLAGVPSIVFGILGLAFIVRGPLSLGFVAAAGSLTLTLLVLPTVIIAAREAIRAVPPSIREGAFALGATRWQTVRREVLPAALPGVLTGVILAIARATGEAAPLLLVGAVTFTTVNPGLFEGAYSTLPVQIFNYSSRPQADFRVLAVAGVIVMLGLVLAMNSVAVWLRNRFEQSW